jgi:hypothetical protein
MLLSAHISGMPSVYQKRYSSAYWIRWANQLLEELSGKDLLPENDYSRGFVIHNGIWITPPSGLRTVKKIYHPQNNDLQYRFARLENEIRLNDVVFDDSTDDQIAITAFTSHATDSVVINIAGYEEDDFEDYLLVITAGTNAGKTYLIGANDASGASTTKIYFLHALPASLSGLVTTGYLIDPDNYVLIDYTATYDAVAVSSDEMPLDDDYEKRIVPAWLRWKAEEESSEISDETLYWQKQYQNTLKDIFGERLSSIGGPFRGRHLTGLVK